MKSIKIVARAVWEIFADALELKLKLNPAGACRTNVCDRVKLTFKHSIKLELERDESKMNPRATTAPERRRSANGSELRSFREFQSSVVFHGSPRSRY